jgi:hypothetical protein
MIVLLCPAPGDFFFNVLLVFFTFIGKTIFEAPIAMQHMIDSELNYPAH